MGTEEIQGMVEPMINLVTTWGLQVIGAVAVLIIGRWLAGAVRRSVTKALTKARTDESLIPFFASMVYYLILAVVVIAVLNLFGIETTSLIAVVGAAGLAIGLALQGTLSNFAAGVVLLIFRPFGKGDVIEAGGSKGSVQEIGLFTTVLNTPDNVKIIVPNAAISSSTISNFSAYPTRRNDLVIGIGYNDNIGKAIGVIQGILDAEDRVLKNPAAGIFVADLGASSVDVAVRPWCKGEDYWGLRADLTRKIKEDLEAAGCSIPFPQRDVHIIPAAE